MNEKIIQEYTKLGQNVDQVFLKQEMDWICEKLLKNIDRFQENFPSACTTNHIYRIKANDDWTNGFWTGMLWMAYQYTKNEAFYDIVMKNIKSFQQRLADHFVLDHHDIGFLYSPSIVMVYRDTQEKSLEKIIVEAADKLLNRFQEKGQFIQAWGQLGNPQEYRLIIDSLLNLPLLYEASKITNNPLYAHKADAHYQQVINHIIRSDYSTYHTFYFDVETGKPDHGATHQGFSDQSCWARGQAWAILGIPLHERITQQKNDENKWTHVFEYFIDKIPQDLIPYWDLCFDDTSHEPKDSSALAIVACGLMEAQKVGYRQDAQMIAKGMIGALSQTYTSSKYKDVEGLLMHGVYAYSENKGVDEENLWGDYFYMEALYRLLNPEWKTCW
ncbi:glycoside hydrolase family 88 protein [Longibaculum muris]|uniref:glycoside hydrolase family 88 protein n=1 Tax=Longibaculum muris TaxID=1796628 RepID=UPI002942F5EE|nr:glycoside hydrolase family 88 protein [Longibaculum muris]